MGILFQYASHYRPEWNIDLSKGFNWITAALISRIFFLIYESGR